MQPARVDAEPLDRARRDPGAEILGVDRERLQRPAEPVIVEQRRRSRTTRAPPPRTPTPRRRRAATVNTTGSRSARTQPHRPTARPSAARQRTVNRVLHIELAQEMLDRQQRANSPTRPRHRRIRTRERSRERLQLPRVLQRILPTKVCHNTMADLAVLIPVPLDQLQIAVLAPDPSTLVSLTNTLPQHYRRYRTNNRQHRTRVATTALHHAPPKNPANQQAASANHSNHPPPTAENGASSCRSSKGISVRLAARRAHALHGCLPRGRR